MNALDSVKGFLDGPEATGIGNYQYFLLQALVAIAEALAKTQPSQTPSWLINAIQQLETK
jgi:hypothetical protein